MTSERDACARPATRSYPGSAATPALPMTNNVMKTVHAMHFILYSTPLQGVPIMALADYRSNRV